MIIAVQRVLKAKVVINHSIYSSIDSGALIFLGVHTNDTEKDAQYLAQKISRLRIFADQGGKMNKNINQIEGSILVVSQFTLYGDTSKGNRPSFLHSANPDYAKELYDYFIDLLKMNKNIVKTGKFGSNMMIELVNDGPVTLILESKR